MPAKPAKDKADNWAALAVSLGFTARAMRDWRKLPNAPQTPDEAAWRAFIEEAGLGIVGNRVGKDREQLLTEKVVIPQPRPELHS